MVVENVVVVVVKEGGFFKQNEWDRIKRALILRWDWMLSAVTGWLVMMAMRRVVGMVTILFCDSKSAIKIAHNEILTNSFSC
jgi:hypothetical protein